MTRLISLLSHYDESPTWLAAHITSLTHIGVTHLITLDGRYPLFPGRRINSTHDTASIILETSRAAGITLTQCHAETPMTEIQKRTRLLELAQVQATPGKDWILILDADERIHTHRPHFTRELDALNPTTETVAITRTDIEDTGANTPTARAHQTLNLPDSYESYDYRLHRVLTNMRYEHTHYTLLGDRPDGTTINYKNDAISRRLGIPCGNIEELDMPLHVDHYKYHRTQRRIQHKDTYYNERNDQGAEVRAAWLDDPDHPIHERLGVIGITLNHGRV
jgi:hypothetical protein